VPGQYLESPKRNANGAGNPFYDFMLGARSNVGRFADGQRRYLEFHRDYVLLRSHFLDEG
jgi:hypothetical protein